MKKYIPLSAIALACTLFASCDLIEGIFKAGVWTGVIVVVLVIALVIWLISKVFGGRG
ncbi:hypothetical protein [Pedobacter insulae]|uniref:Phosphatidate cytidylyltransferase n=1 Tax=Pedobacter insulae TaxID=414048 RepID=A0A1I2ZTJ1_9SPHI|nr:hypothetical protein [Pedobacter insulae]SFH41108.1 hypothetical protein SAMN04489864_11184 [Pedobacter insulae]